MNSLSKSAIRSGLGAASLLALMAGGMAFADDHGEKAAFDNTEIKQYSVGPVLIGMTIAEARKAAPQLVFTHEGGPENSILVEARMGDALVMEISTLKAVEFDDEGNMPPLDPDAIIAGITVYDRQFSTVRGIHPGVSTDKAGQIYGDVAGVYDDPHIGEAGTFAMQPDWMHFTFQPAKDGGADKAGIYVELEECNPPRWFVAKSFTPGAFIDRVGIGPSYTSETSIITNAPGFSRIVREKQLKCENDNPVTIYEVTLSDVIPGFQGRIEHPSDFADCEDEREFLTRVDYKDQSNVMAMDINFDDVPDLAIYRGNIGGYGSPAYDIFLFDEPSASWVQHEELSELTMSLGMFDINTEDQTFTVYGKSGCCYHMEAKYRFAMEEAEMDAMPNLGPLQMFYEKSIDSTGDGEAVVTERKLVDGQWVETKRAATEED